MDVLLHDLRLAIRQLRRKPAFTATAVLTLAVGMGVNAVAFTVVNGLLFKPTATSARPDVARVLTTPGGDEGGYASLPDFSRFVDATNGSIELAAEGRSAVAWRHDGTSDTAWVLYVTPNYFSMVDVTVIAGRLEVKGPSVVIGERFWRDQLGAASIAGLTLRLNDTDVSVAGVLPDSYTGPAGIYSPDVWLPLDELKVFGASPKLSARDTRWLFLFGRMAPGATVPQVQGQLDAAAVEMARDWPDTHADRGARVRLLNLGNSERRGLSYAAAIGMGIIGLVLLIACFNVANLLLARAVERERDMGLRAALGAQPSRLVRLVVTEGFVIATMSGALALLLAWWTQTLVGAFAIPIEEPQHLNLSPDFNVAGFVVALVLVAGVLPGLWPALAAARVDLARVLGAQGGASSGGRPSRLRRGLVAAQIAGSTMFLALAALFVQSFNGMAVADYGFATDQLILAEVAPATQGLDAARSQQYIEALRARLEALPGIASAAVIDRAPFFVGFDRTTTIGTQQIPTYRVGPGYFKTMGIGLIAGRELSPGSATNDVIVNQPLAKKLWGDAQAVGQVMRADPSTPGGRSGQATDLFTVVGVTAKAHTRGLDRPAMYVPLSAEAYESELTVVARTTGEATSFLKPAVDAAHEVDANIALQSVKTMAQRMDVQLWPFHTVSWVFSICGGLALLMATVGLSGMVIHAVNRRRREFGVRMSVGASSKDLMMDVLKGSTALLLPGLIAGVILSAAGARVMQVVFIGVNVLNPITYLGVALVECLIVVIACLPPAVRASRVDPLIALRAE